MSNTVQNNITVSVKYGELDDVISWCTDNCKQTWDLAEITEYGGASNGSYLFSFYDDRDALCFTLRWS